MCIDKKFIYFGLAGIFAIDASVHAVLLLLGWTVIVPEAGFVLRGTTNLYLFVASVLLSYIFLRMYESTGRAKKRRR